MRFRLPQLHRALRICPSAAKRFSSAVHLVQSGVFGTLSWRGAFIRDGQAVSPWHDISLKPRGNPDGVYTYVNEIPAGSFEKLEVCALKL
jgi:hypothetical protein